MKFRVLIEPDEDGVFVAECPVLPGCVSQGQTRAEAAANIRDAIQGYLRSLEKHGDPVPAPITEEIVEVPQSSLHCCRRRVFMRLAQSLPSSPLASLRFRVGQSP